MAVIAARQAARRPVWVATLPPPRGATAMLLRRHSSRRALLADAIRTFDTRGAAYRAAREIATEADRILFLAQSNRRGGLA